MEVWAWTDETERKENIYPILIATENTVEHSGGLGFNSQHQSAGTMAKELSHAGNRTSSRIIGAR